MTREEAINRLPVVLQRALCDFHELRAAKGVQENHAKPLFPYPFYLMELLSTVFASVTVSMIIVKLFTPGWAVAHLILIPLFFGVLFVQSAWAWRAAWKLNVRAQRSRLKLLVIAWGSVALIPGLVAMMCSLVDRPWYFPFTLSTVFITTANFYAMSKINARMESRRNRADIRLTRILNEDSVRLWQDSPADLSEEN